MTKWLFSIFMVCNLLGLMAQDSLSYVIIAHAFNDRGKAEYVASNYAKKAIKCQVVEAGKSGIFRVCLNRYPDYFSAEVSRKALIKGKTIPADAWILTEKVSKDLLPIKEAKLSPPPKATTATKQHLIYNGKVYKVPVLKTK